MRAARQRQFKVISAQFTLECVAAEIAENSLKTAILGLKEMSFKVIDVGTSPSRVKIKN